MFPLILTVLNRIIIVGPITVLNRDYIRGSYNPWTVSVRGAFQVPGLGLRA